MFVDRQYFKLNSSFETESGAVIQSPVVCFEEYGNLNGEVIYIAHGGLSSQHAAGYYTENDLNAGWWDGVIGPDCAIDTNKYRVICANALGSMFGSSSAASKDMETGDRVGPKFPEITMIDMAKFSKMFLDNIGVEKLHMMAGPSMGSLQSLQMAALYPDYVKKVVAVATAGRMPPSGMSMHHLMINIIQMDPQFNNGLYKDDECRNALRMIHQIAKIYYTHESGIKDVCWDSITDSPDSQQKRSANISRYLLNNLDNEIYGRDPNCYLTLTKATNSFDLGIGAESYESGVRRITCPLLLINVDTDCEFAPMWGKEVGDILNGSSPGQAQVKVINSPWGHLGCIREIKQINDLIKEFLENG